MDCRNGGIEGPCLIGLDVDEKEGWRLVGQALVDLVA